MRRNCLTLSVIVAALAAAGCGSSDKTQSPSVADAKPSPSAPAPVDACKVVSKAEVEQTFGITATEQKQGMNAGMASDCSYMTADSAMVSVLIRRSPVPERADQVKEEIKKRMANVTIHDVSGLGDFAFYTDMKPMGTQLNVFSRGNYILITMFGLKDEGAASKAAEKLSRTVLERL